MSALRELAAACQFGVLHDDMLRDHLIEKTAVLQVREKLLLESSTLICARAIELACQIESALNEARTLTEAMTASATQDGTIPVVQLLKSQKQQVSETRKESTAACMGVKGLVFNATTSTNVRL